MVLVIKNLPANAGDVRDMESIPGLVRFPGVGNGNPLQYSCLENRMDRGTCWAIVHSVTKYQTLLKRLSMHVCTVQVNWLEQACMQLQLGKLSTNWVNFPD